MKIQCACGTKVAFDITPDMATNPVQFICPNCGLDSSLMVNQLIRQELGVSSAPPATPPAGVPLPPQGQPAPVPVPIAPPRTVPVPVPVVAPRPAMRISTPSAAPAAAAPATGAEVCLKHRSQPFTHKCLVCGKPMCPDCMALFGYVCSPLCRNKAETRGMDVPVYALQKSVLEARRWRKIGLIGGGIGGVLALLVGFWFWYAWFGSVPKVAYSYLFADRAEAGEVRLAGADQLVFLHGGELGRIDMKKSEPSWTVQLVDTNKFISEAEETVARIIKAHEIYVGEHGGGDHFKMPSRDKVIEELTDAAIRQLELQVAGQNIWVASEDTLTRYDWETGKADKTIPLEGGRYSMHREGDELLLAESSEDLTSETTRHINLLTGESTKETIEKPVPPKLMALLTEAVKNQTTKAGSRNKNGSAAVKAVTAKVVAANEARRLDQPLDPQKIADQAQNMSYAAKIALPALIANARNQQRIAAELADEGAQPKPPTELDQALVAWDSTHVVPAADGLVQFTRTLLERKIVAREAMKAAPKKSALDGNVSAANSMSVANEMLNEMQRGLSSKVMEDLSRYQVTVKRTGADTPVWTAEVVGPPKFHPLQTVDIITAGTKAIAIDHDNKKLWEEALNFPVLGGGGGFDDFEGFGDMGGFGAPGGFEMRGSGLGPCVERGDTIYIYDQGTLSAFDRATGEARWRLPSVGISGLWFDDKGMIYVNTTTASPEKIRYSKQINLNDQTLTQILKVDPKTGKTLWSRAGAKHICYMWKKYIYTTDCNAGPDPDGEGLGMTTGLETPAFVRIRRIDAGSGRILWEHVQKRCPLDLQFHENTIQLMFHKEVQELKFLVL